MGAIAIRRSVLDAMSPRRRQLITYAAQTVALVEPALFTDGANEWYVFDDGRIDVNDVGVAAQLMTRPIPGNYSTAGRGPDELRADARGFANPRRPDNADDEPWGGALKANGAPATMRADSGVPEGLVPA